MIKNKIKDRLKQLEDIARKSFPNVGEISYAVRWDLKGKVAGWCIRENGNYYFRFNLDIATNNETDFIQNTVAHEFAHMLTGIMYPRESGHGKYWQYVMRKLGIENPSRCHNYKGVKPARNTRSFSYSCNCNTVHILGIVSHKRAQECKLERGYQLYRCTKCRKPLEFEREVLE